MTKAVFCGTFDPVTKGHIDIIERACRIFDTVIVFVSVNSEKTMMFSKEQRLEWLRKAAAHLENVMCKETEGLTVDACKKEGATILIRGLRNSIDFSYEQNMASMNQLIDPSLETICLYTKPEYAICSSSNVKELLKYHLDASALVPACVWNDLKEAR